GLVGPRGRDDPFRLAAGEGEPGVGGVVELLRIGERPGPLDAAQAGDALESPGGSRPPSQPPRPPRVGPDPHGTRAEAAGNSPTRVATEGEQAALRQTAIQMNDPIARTSAAVIRYDGHRSSWRRSHERPDGRVQGLIDPRDRIREGSRDVPRRA